MLYNDPRAYGDNFRYDEAMLTGKGFSGRMKALGLTTGTGAFLAAAALAPSRWVLEKFVVPKPGEGPSPAAQKAGFYDLRFVGKTESGARLQVRVTGAGDPGYGSTAKLLGQAAVSLAKDIADDVPGGFWTPASLMGDALLSRLSSAADLTFEVQE